MQKEIKSLFTILLILIFLNYRDFLYTIKIMNFHFYNFQMIPFDPYYKIILKYAGIIDQTFRFPWEWRLIPNIVNLITFKLMPCYKMSVVPDIIDLNTYCSIWSISIVNFLAGALSQIMLGFYALTKLKRDKIECIFLILTSYFLIKFLDPFGVDRISFLFLIIFLFFAHSKLSYIFIIISILVNDKCLLFITTYYFATNFDLKNIKHIFLNFKFLLSVTMSSLYLMFISKTILHISSAEVSYNYFTLTSLSNSLIPSFFIIYGFIVNYNKPEIFKKFKLNRYFLFFIFNFFILGLFVGGPGNMGRYIVFGSLCFFPVLNYEIMKLLKKLVTKI